MIRPLCLGVLAFVMSGSAAFAEPLDDEQFERAVHFYEARAEASFAERDDNRFIDQAIRRMLNFRVTTSVVLYGDNVTDKHVALLTGTGAIRKLVIFGCPLVSDACVKSLAAMTGLVDLKIYSGKLTGETMSQLSRTNSLRSLTLDGCKITKKGMASICSLRHLRELSLVNSGITDESLVPVSNLVLLERLNLNNNALTLASLASFRPLMRLSELSFVGTLSGDERIAQLPTLPNLRELYLLSASDNGVRELARFRALERVISTDSHRLSADGIRTLTQVPNLAFLGLGDVVLTDANVKDLEKCKNLRTFDLRAKSCPLGLVASLAALPRLETVKLHLKEVPEKFCEPFADARGLTKLIIVAPIGDDGVKAISKCPCLTELELDDRGITPAGLRALKNVHTLERLLCDSREDFYPVIKELKEQIPGLSVNPPTPF